MHSKYGNNKEILKPINKNNLGQYTNNNNIILPVIKPIINTKNNIDQSKKNHNAGKYVNYKKITKLKPINQNNLGQYTNNNKNILKPIKKKKNDYIDYCKKHNGGQIVSGLHNKQIIHNIKIDTTKLGKGGDKKYK